MLPLIKRIVFIAVLVTCLSTTYAADYQPPTLSLDQLTSTEISEAIENGFTSIILATGGIEPNGPWVITGKHNKIIAAMSNQIARHLGKTLVAPVIGFVPQTGHLGKPGTIGINETTFYNLLIDVADSLRRSGFNKIIFIGDSGGNQTGMKTTASSLNRQWQDKNCHAIFIPEYYQQDRWSYNYLKSLGYIQQPDTKSAMRNGLHSDLHYEAILAVLDPNFIRSNKRRLVNDFQIHGIDLDPIKEIIDLGKKLVTYRVEITINALKRHPLYKR